MSECTHESSSCSQGCDSRTQPESLLEKPHAQSHIRKVIGISSGKGGVGKSMVTALLAVLAQRQGLKVGILDADITGPSIPRAFGLTEKATGIEEGIFPVRTQTGIDVMSLNLLLENTSVAENRKTGEKSPTVRYIDFTHLTNNRFIAICQFKVRILGTEHHIIPDIVLFLPRMMY